jgi:hypothetical protein
VAAVAVAAGKSGNCEKRGKDHEKKAWGERVPKPFLFGYAEGKA